LPSARPAPHPTAVGRQQLLHQHRQSDPAGGTRARAQRAGGLRGAGLTRHAGLFAVAATRRRCCSTPATITDRKPRGDRRHARSGRVFATSRCAQPHRFLMITLAIGQNPVGHGYAGRASPTATTASTWRPARRLRLSLAAASPFYYATLVTFLLACWPWRFRALAVRGEPARHARPGSPHDRARYNVW